MAYYAWIDFMVMPEVEEQCCVSMETSEALRLLRENDSSLTALNLSRCVCCVWV